MKYLPLDPYDRFFQGTRMICVVDHHSVLVSSDESFLAVVLESRTEAPVAPTGALSTALTSLISGHCYTRLPQERTASSTHEHSESKLSHLINMATSEPSVRTHGRAICVMVKYEERTTAAPLPLGQAELDAG